MFRTATCEPADVLEAYFRLAVAADIVSDDTTISLIDRLLQDGTLGPFARTDLLWEVIAVCCASTHDKVHLLVDYGARALGLILVSLLAV